MRRPHVLLVSALLALAWGTPATAQISEAERAAARELFRQGDELQRASKFAEALDRFQRAQQVFSAPTNLLRMAECDAALGRLVESAEAYRAVVRTPLPPGSPPAFQAAIDQARAELAQVDPRVPRLLVKVEAPAGAAGMQLQIDGQSVPAALIGEPIPLDPGAHRVLALASGLAAPEQQVVLHEQENRTVSFTLVIVPGGGDAAPLASPPPGPASSPAPTATAPGGSGEGAPPGIASRASLLLGAHLGLEFPSGKLPGGGPLGESIDADAVGASGLAYAFDGGLRFARRLYAGVTLEHASFGGGNLSGLPMGDTHASSNATLLGVVIGLILTPERPSLYGEIGLADRWFSYKEGGTGGSTSGSYTSPELTLGAGFWIPAGRAWRLVPKATLTLGAFDPAGDKNATSQGHAFFMVGVTGYYNAEL